MPSLSRTLLLVGGGLSVALVLGYGVAYAADDDRVARGVVIAGTGLAGLDRAGASSVVAEAVGPAAAAPVRLLADGEELVLDPATAGLRLDPDATADDALSAGPLDRLRALLGAQRSVSPAVAVDEAVLRVALTGLAEGFDRQPVEGAVGFDDDAAPVPTMSAAGRTLDVDGAVEQVREEWLQSDEPALEVPVDVEEVSTTEDDVREAVATIAEPAVAAPVFVEVEGDTFEVRPADIARGFDVVTEDGELVGRLDAEAVLESVGPRVRAVEQPAVDATFDTSSGTPVVVPSQDGRTVTAEELGRVLQPVLTAEPPRRVSAGLTVTPARVSTERAQGLGVVEEISTFTTRHPCCAPRVTNIQQIAKLVDGHVVLPGEVFSLNGLVGPRDAARGFVAAPQILRGEFVDDIGGGISQFATTLFNAVFFAGLEDVEHSPHSYYISRYPAGREATMSFPEPDLKFRNDSPHGVLIRTSFTSTSITVAFWGTKRFDVESESGPRTRPRPFEVRYLDRPDCRPSPGNDGFDIVVTRVFKQDGRVVRREPFSTRYLPQPDFRCGKPPRGSAGG